MDQKNDAKRGTLAQTFIILAAGIIALVAIAKIIELKSASAVAVPIGMLLLMIVLFGRSGKSKPHGSDLESGQDDLGRPPTPPTNPFIFTKRWAAQLAVWMVGVLLVLKWDDIVNKWTRQNHWPDSVQIPIFLAGTVFIVATSVIIYRRLFRAPVVSTPFNPGHRP